MMLPKEIFASVRERDVDLLLLEELTVSPIFREHWLKCVGIEGPHTLVKAWHSLSEAGEESVQGESDLVMLVTTGAGRRVAVMIEDKIAAAAQPNQGLRYAGRGGKGVADDSWDEFKTCIVAPQSYLDSSQDAKTFDARISYESVVEWLEAGEMDAARSVHKRALLTSAMEQQRRGYVAVEDAAVMQFSLVYWEIASANFAELGMRKPVNKPSNATWVHEFAKPVPGMALVHKMPEGYVDLQAAGWGDRVDDLREANGDVLEGIEIHKAGKSAAFRIEVPPLDPHGDPKEQEYGINVGLTAARRLDALAKSGSIRLPS